MIIYDKRKSRGFLFFWIVLDATSAKHHIFESVISVRNGDSVTYRGPADPNSYVHLRRKLPMEKEFAMYEENNLKRIC